MDVGEEICQNISEQSLKLNLIIHLIRHSFTFQKFTVRTPCIIILYNGQGYIGKA